MHASMPQPVPQPERLGPYTVLEPLGRGSLGIVYRGIDPATRRTVVLKTVLREFIEPEGTAAGVRFQDEVGAAARLRHPGIVAVYESGELPELDFVAMEYVEGSGLCEQLRVPIADAVSILSQVLDALDYAHEQGVVHQDIKPSNLLLTYTGQIKITDFAVARIDVARPHTTETGYMSPEQFMNMPVDRRSDLFCVGVLFYELLTGVNPFAGPAEELVNRVCNQRERAPSEVHSDLPPVFDSVCARALAKPIHARYPTARAFGDAVRSAYLAAYRSAPPPAVSPQTVSLVTSSRAKLRANQAAGERSQPVVQPARSGNRGWEESTLRAVEQQLAAYLGPIAKIVVKQAASKTTDLHRLYLLASESLEREEERQAFLARQSELHRNDAKPAPAVPSARPSAPPSPSPSPRANPKPQDIESRQERSPAKSEESRPQLVRPAAKPPREAVPSRQALPQRELPAELWPLQHADSRPKVERSPAASPRAGSQAPTLAAYLKAKPSPLSSVIHAFVATVEALIETTASNPKLEALTPDGVVFDALGKAHIRNAQTASTETGGGTADNLRYAAPESFAEKAGESVSAVAAHVYALGFMFYEILLGRQLFENTFADLRTDLDWLRWHADMERKAPEIRSLIPECPYPCSSLIESMMEKHADKRMQDLQAILARLRTLAKQTDDTVEVGEARRRLAEGSMPKRRKRGRFGLVLLLLVLVALASAGYFIWQDSDYRELALNYIATARQLFLHYRDQLLDYYQRLWGR